MSNYLEKKDLQTSTKTQTLAANAHHLLCFLRLSPNQSFTLKDIIATSHRSKSVCLKALDLLIDQHQVEKIAQTNGANGRFTDTRYRVTTTPPVSNETPTSFPCKSHTGDAVGTTTTPLRGDLNKKMKNRDSQSGHGDSAVRFDFTTEEQKILDALQESYDFFTEPELMILLDKRMKLYKEDRPNCGHLYAHHIYSTLKPGIKYPKNYIEKTFLMPESTDKKDGYFKITDDSFQTALDLVYGKVETSPSQQKDMPQSSENDTPLTAIYSNNLTIYRTTFGDAATNKLSRHDQERISTLTDSTRWQLACEYWKSRGWNPLNIDGLLDRDQQYEFETHRIAREHGIHLNPEITKQYRYPKEQQTERLMAEAGITMEDIYNNFFKEACDANTR